MTAIIRAVWVTQQLRDATAWGEGPRFLIRDNDDKFGGRHDGPEGKPDQPLYGGRPISWRSQLEGRPQSVTRSNSGQSALRSSHLNLTAQCRREGERVRNKACLLRLLEKAPRPVGVGARRNREPGS